MKEESNPFNAFEEQSKQFNFGFWGILLLALGLIIAFTFVPLPSKLVTKGVLSTVNPALPIELELDGKVSYVHNTNSVNVGTTIIEIEKDIESETIEQAIELLNSITSGAEVDLASINQLDDLQYAWNDLVANYNGIQLDPARLKYLQKVNQGRSKLNNFQVERAELLQLIALSKQEYELIEARYIENKKLFEQGGISKQELDSWQKEVLAVEQKLSELDIQQIRIQSAQSSLQQSLLAEEQLMGLDKNLKLINFEKQLSDLQNMLNIRLSKQKILSPIQGSLILSSDMIVGSYHKAGKVAANLYPGDIDHSIRFFIQAKDKHKLEIDNKVRIYPEDFPKQKYGYLNAKIKTINSVNENGLYEFNIQIDSLVSNKGKLLDVTPGMHAMVKVSTRSESLIDRIRSSFNP